METIYERLENALLNKWRQVSQERRIVCDTFKFRCIKTCNSSWVVGGKVCEVFN
jgi:hypothetical protein